VAKHLESTNTMFSFIWWIIGFYWVSAGSQSLVKESPLVYWFVLPQLPLFSMLCIIFLGFDVFFIVFCENKGRIRTRYASEIGHQMYFYVYCWMDLVPQVLLEEGASKEDIEQLSKYKIWKVENSDKLAGNTGHVGGVITECRSDSPGEHVLTEDNT
ncbi:hypothetical protein HN51_007037, partial [Arachis hypogaea]